MRMMAAAIFGLLGGIIGAMGALGSLAAIYGPRWQQDQNSYASITFPLYLLVLLVGARWFVEEQAKQSINADNVDRNF